MSAIVLESNMPTLKMVNRLIEPSDGRILIDGVDISGQDVTELRRGIGYVIQQVGLFPHQGIAENISTVPRLLGYAEAIDVEFKVSPWRDDGVLSCELIE